MSINFLGTIGFVSSQMISPWCRLFFEWFANCLMVIFPVPTLYKSAVHFVMQIQQPEPYRPQKKFSQAFRLQVTAALSFSFAS
jgi:hypothetical protein